MMAAVVHHKTVRKSKAIAADLGRPAPGAFVQRLGQLIGLGHRMPTASGGHQSEWTTISNQCYTFAAVVAVYNRTEPGRSGMLSEAINLLIKKIICIGQRLREFHEYRLRLLRCGTTWQSRANTTTRPTTHSAA
jgi:hypothetical protein